MGKDQNGDVQIQAFHMALYWVRKKSYIISVIVLTLEPLNRVDPKEIQIVPQDTENQTMHFERKSKIINKNAHIFRKEPVAINCGLKVKRYV